MHGAIPPLPQYVFMWWCIVKHKDTFTFTLTVRMFIRCGDDLVKLNNTTYIRCKVMTRVQSGNFAKCVLCEFSYFTVCGVHFLQFEIHSCKVSYTRDEVHGNEKIFFLLQFKVFSILKKF
jgi:hypothetical protein